MLEDEEIVDSSFSDNIHGQGLLKKLDYCKNYRDLTERAISFLKCSSDPQVLAFCDEVALNTIKSSSDVNSSSKVSKNIGLRKTIKIIPGLTDDSIIKVNLFDYNYNLAKKFKYLKNETISSGDTIVVVHNLYDKRGLENISALLDDIHKFKLNKAQVIVVLIKSTNNFLHKLTEKSLIDGFKLEYNMFPKYIEVDEDALKNVDAILLNIIQKIK